MLAYAGLPSEIKENVELFYKAMEKVIGSQRSTLDTRDLLVLIFICVGNAVKSETNAGNGKASKIKKLGLKNNIRNVKDIT